MAETKSILQIYFAFALMVGSLSMLIDEPEEGDDEREIFVTTGGGETWATKSQLQELRCLLRIAFRAAVAETRLSTKLRVSPELGDEDAGNSSGSHNENGSPSIDLKSIWTPANPDIVASMLVQRILRTNFSDVLIPVIISNSSAQTVQFNGFLDAFRRIAAAEVPNVEITDPIQRQSSEIREAVSELVKRLQASPEPGKNTYVLMLSHTNDVKPAFEYANNHSEAFNRTMWLHPDAFDLFQSMEKNHDEETLKFAERVGLTTVLVFPTQKFSDVDLRKARFMMLSNSCPVYSVQRALAFVKTLKTVLKEDNEALPSTWEAWSMFVVGQNHREAVQVVQNSPWVVDEAFTVKSGEKIPSTLGHITGEAIRKEYLVGVYAPAATQCDTLGPIILKTVDPFTLEPVHRFYPSGNDLPTTLIVPQNHGLSIDLRCADGAQRGAEISCAGDVENASPCIHSAFKRRSKRGIAAARRFLAVLDAQRATYPVLSPERTWHPSGFFQRGLNVNESDGTNNDAGLTTNEFLIDERKRNESRAVNATFVPYRIRQKAAIAYKMLYETGLNSEQMLKALPEVGLSDAVRKETERLIHGLPDSRLLQAIAADRQTGGPKPKYPLPPYAKVLLGSMGTISGCLGTSLGSLLCSNVGAAISNFAIVTACHNGGLMHMGGSCFNMLGRIFQAFYDDQSVICSALHERGLLTDFEYAVDSAFGRRLQSSDPRIIDGYHFLASPIVSLMKRSSSFASLVSFLTRPWIDQMMFESGYSGKESIVGDFLLSRGTEAAKAVAVLKDDVEGWMETLHRGVARVTCVSVASLSSLFVFRMLQSR